MKPLEIRKASAHELVTVAACCLSGTLTLVSGVPGSAVLAATFGRWSLIAFNAALVVGALIVFWGALMTERAVRGRGGDLSDGLAIERVGLGVSAPLLASYVTAVFVASGVRGLLPAAVCLAVVIAHALRMRRITLDLRAWSRAVQNPTAADPPPLAEADPGTGEA